jgi:predicted RNA-binding Zn ribbon-like protein
MRRMGETRQPAPGRLGLIERLVNTLDIETGEDAIRDAPGLHGWLNENGYGGEAGPDDVARAADAREGLRALLSVNAGMKADKRAIQAFNGVLAPLPLGVEVTLHGGIELGSPGGGLDGLLADVSQAILEARADGSWTRLKVCRSDDCRWAYYDRSKNRSSAWCTMAECGSREKVRAYRSRRSGG